MPSLCDCAKPYATFGTLTWWWDLKPASFIPSISRLWTKLGLGYPRLSSAHTAQQASIDTKSGLHTYHKAFRRQNQSSERVNCFQSNYIANEQRPQGTDNQCRAARRLLLQHSRLGAPLPWGYSLYVHPGLALACIVMALRLHSALHANSPS